MTAVYSAPVNSDGTIGTWTTATNTLPTARAFGTMVVFGGIIYYIDGDPNASIPPNNQGVGDKDVYFASAVRGVVGSWTLNANLTIHDRAKGVLFTAYGPSPVRVFIRAALDREKWKAPRSMVATPATPR